ncbi:extracellular matrix regulator RemB [Evansella tamaricis]|uniref:DUF370 domain-containing protein n=1 Tax=Evansella tamaricis TaxID=2069301 RepID=A0ABS6JAP5_9BACI|nr:DUF370 domain-containing protein [Evansella tamaricis]MBU9710606.1 DUF370 domain-containing protein [Evansella tamaricis]
MFIHLGGDMVLRSKKIIAILDQTNESQDNQQFLISQEKEKKTIQISEDNTKSVVITDSHIYLSPISSHTLKRRAETVTVIEEEE